MFRYFSMALVSFAGLGLAAPQMSHAQAPVGVQVRVGPASFAYQPGYTYVPPPYVVPAPVVVAPVAPAAVVVRPRVVIGGPVFYPWHWNGHRWYRHERFEHHR